MEVDKPDKENERKVILEISDDVRKSILYDVIKITREEAHKRLTVVLTFLMICIAIFSYIGYEHLTKSFVSNIFNEKYNPKLIEKLESSEKQLQSVLDEGKKIKDRLVEQEKKLMRRIDSKEKELINLTQMIASFEITNHSIESVINENVLIEISNYEGFQYIQPLGLSDTTIFKTLVTYGNLNPVRINESAIFTSVAIIQSKFKLVPDGKMGPCTSLLLAAVSLRLFPNDTTNELKKSIYKENLWYLNIFKTCFDKDKKVLKDALKYDDNPLHFELSKVTELIGSHKKHIFNMLSVKSGDSIAYEALDTLLRKRKSRITNEKIIKEF